MTIIKIQVENAANPLIHRKMSPKPRIGSKKGSRSILPTLNLIATLVETSIGSTCQVLSKKEKFSSWEETIKYIS